MESQRFDSLRQGGAGCPSDLMLDRLHAGELSQRAADELKSHVAQCAMCPQRVAARQVGFDGFPDLDTRPLLAGIARRVGEEDAVKSRRFSLGKLLAILTPVGAAAAVAVFLLVGRNSQTDQPERLPTPLSTPLSTREKGGIALHVFRQTSDAATEAISGDSFKPGDRIRFVVDLAQSGQINVLGVESGGTLYVAWPQEQGTALQYEAGKAQALPGAVILDDSAGRESLYLVSCPTSVGAPSVVCKSTGAQTAPSCPVDCSQSVFVLDKRK